MAEQGTEPTVGFVGLGAMGYHMASHIARLPGRRCFVWNRTASKAEQHAREHGSAQAEDLTAIAQARVLLLCLPTSEQDLAVTEAVAPHMSRGSCIVSCTSGDPTASRRLAGSLLERFGLHFVDCPVSGGPRGAAAGSLACMLGANNKEAIELVEPVVRAFASKVVLCGPAGAGHAVKAVNNALNVAHLLMGAEGLLALQSMGVEPAVALEAINGSSGRSLQTEQRLPQEVLTGRFGYGFKLPLMAKDCRIAESLIRDGFPKASLLPAAVKLVEQATAEESAEADYTSVVKLLERQAGQELRTNKSSTASDSVGQHS